MSFVHLHCHSEFSLLDGAMRTKDMLEQAQTMGMPAIALTDHGNLYGAINFYIDAQKANKKHPESPIKPILGCEVYLAPSSKSEQKQLPGRRIYTHLTLLAENDTGWRNLVKLVTRGHLEGMYYKPRVDRQDLRDLHEGIIALTGCLAGPANEWLLQDKIPQARETLSELKEIFGENNLFVEIQDHGLAEQTKVLPMLVDLAKELELPLVASNDAHFLKREDHDAHDVLICIGTGKLQADPNRMRYSQEMYLKSPQEMHHVFKDYPEACANTLRIAERCNVKLKLDSTSSEKYPQFEAPDGSPREEYIRKVCFEGLIERYGEERAQNDEELRERLDFELKTINQMGFASYFLITADFINWARDHNIPVGPGRGSAAGSLVAYTMGITNICPIRFGLLFERFLNPQRVSPPDVDIDFCQTRRPEVIQYVREKYGDRCVSHIITYGTMGAKSVLRDVARVLNVDYADADRLAKMIETAPKVSLKKEFDSKEELRQAIENSDIYTQLWSYALKLEGLVRNVGVHAAGVVIGDRDLDEHVPLTRDKEGLVVAQYDMGAITEVGLLKMDFLGLKNLTVIQDAENFIRRQMPDFDINNVPLDDAATLAVLNRGETMGVFQLESGGMVNVCRRYGIDSIDDIIALLALYRPGAMQFIDQMIEVKKGFKKPYYEHPLMETVASETFGVMIYQEQVQNAAKLIAGYSLGGADLLRRAMGKKDMEKMAKEKENFIKGAWETNQVPEDLARKIFDKIESFAGYGFNKSHSACYGHISYWTAYLKANFPVEFIAALLSNEMNNTEKIGVFIAEANRMGIEVLPPDINHSQIKFNPEQLPNGKWGVRYGLAAIKNVSAASMAALIEERNNNGEFTSMDDVCTRIDSKNLRKNNLECLVKAGAFDFTHQPRASLFEHIEYAINSAAQTHRDKEIGQTSLFDLLMPEPTQNAAQKQMGPLSKEWDKEEKLAAEKELLGYYFCGHPLDAMRNVIDLPKYLKIGTIQDLEDDEIKGNHEIAGMVRSCAVKMSKAGKSFAILTLEDLTGSTEILLWDERYTKAKEKECLDVGTFIRIKIRLSLDDRTQSKRVSASSIDLLVSKSRQSNQANSYSITLHTTRHNRADVEQIKDILSRYPGKTKVILTLRNTLGNVATLELGENFRVTPSPALAAELSMYD